MREFIIKLSVLCTKTEQKKILLLLIGMVIMGGIEVIGVVSIAPFMAVVANPSIIQDNNMLLTIYTYFQFSSENRFLAMLGIVVVVTIVISNSFTALMTWQMTHFSNMQGHNLAVRLLQQYLDQPYIFFLGRNSADLGKNILAEIQRIISNAVLPGMLSLSKLVVTTFIISFLLYLDAQLALIVITILGGFYWLTYRLVRSKVKSMAEAVTHSHTERYKIANEAMSGIKELKLYGGESEFIKRFSIPSELNANYSSLNAVIATLPRYALEAVAFGGVVLIVIYLISTGKNREEIIPIISLYALAGYRLMPSLQQIYQGITQIKHVLPAVDILINDLDNTNLHSKLLDKQQEPLQFNNQLTLHDLSFSYPNIGKAVINKLNLTIKPNTTIGLIGSTGSGKTTLIDILLGLLEPDSGEMVVDNKKIDQKNILFWQKKLAYVPQTIYLTDDTISNNIAFAIPVNEIDEAKIKEVVKLAELEQFVKELPEQYQTQVGERGVRLSGGQRQRIGIARALYRSPDILVLDEATSALDGITENVIMDAIHSLSHKKTIIIIAHRLATVKECDVIHIMEEGNITASGSYTELLNDNEQFKKMVSSVG